VTNQNDRHDVSARLGKRHRTTAFVLAGVVLGMVGMAYAAVPLYRIFCQTTGFAGTPLIAKKGADEVLDQTVEVRFDANVATDLPWKFKPKQATVTARLGETLLVYYTATNTSAVTTRGTASYNVSPDSAGAYFNKIECFCFTEQKLEPGQTVDMPVSFFIDPVFAKDNTTKDLPVITLSYTFYAMDKPATTSGRDAGKSGGGSG